MRRAFLIAANEFLTAVLSKTFLIAVLIVPATGALLMMVVPLFTHLDDVRIDGDVVVIDEAGLVRPELVAAFDPRRVAARRLAEAKAAFEEAPPVIRRFLEVKGDSTGAIEAAIGGLFQVRLREAGTSDFDAVRRSLFATPPASRPLALAVVHADAATRKPGAAEFGTYDLYVPAGVDDRVEAAIRESLDEAVVGARLRAHDGARASGLTRDALAALEHMAYTPAVAVTAEGSRRNLPALNIVVPAAFGILLLLGVVIGGQSLMTSIIEERSSRILEVLLSSVSPVVLMSGKLAGQMAVSLAFMSIYIGGGMLLLTSLSLAGLIDMSLLVYLAIFFVITYLVMGSLMLALGAAVENHDDAEFFKAPIMLTLIVPWILWLPISRDPNSVLSVSISFIPPFNTFAMLLRLSSITPPPAWQVWLSIAIGVASVWAALWFAAKVLRVSLLMTGKTPSLRELVRMARAG